MNGIFVKIDEDFQNAVATIYHALGISNFLIGDSLNVPAGNYGTCSFLGVRILAHMNDYDYKTQYNYVIFIEKDPLLSVYTPKNVEIIAGMVADILTANFQGNIAVESDGIY